MAKPTPGRTPSPQGETGAPQDGAPDAAGRDAQRIARVVLAVENTERLSPLLARDVAQAISDLAHDNNFAPRGLAGPFTLHLAMENGRLVLDIRDASDAPLHVIALALGPFRRLVKDYLLLVESHEMAVAEGREQRMEAIDMGRRGLHNEGAALMMERLEGKVAIDFETARRLFTLVCVLHQRF